VSSIANIVSIPRSSRAGRLLWDSPEHESISFIDSHWVVRKHPVSAARTRRSKCNDHWRFITTNRVVGETDLLASAPPLDWTAQWIGRNNPLLVPVLGLQARAPLLRKEFVLGNSVTSATLRISGLGFYEAFINGRRVGDQVLDPPPTVYNETALYVTFDVTDLLRRGANAIGVTLGRGYFGATASDAFNLGSAPLAQRASAPPAARYHVF
jgi:hypothetical protein